MMVEMMMMDQIILRKFLKMIDHHSIYQCFDVWKDRINKLITEHPLQIISWEATRRCNLNCVHCGSPSEEVILSEELTTQEVTDAFYEIANDFDMSKFRHINITGGEPFVRKDLLNILEKISKIPYYNNIDIQTNGIFLANHPELYNELRKFGVTGIGVSIDGLEETHDNFRRKKGSFKKTVQSAKLSVENGFVTTVSVVAHSKNINEIPAFYSFVKSEIKPRIFRIMTIDPIGRIDFDSEYLLNKEQIRWIVKFLQGEYQKHCLEYSDPKTTMVELGCGGWFGKELEGTFRPFIFHCIAGINNLGILYDGKLGSCSNISREFIQGDLRKEKIKDVWYNRYQQYRNKNLLGNDYCIKCEDWDFCHGGPMHLLNFKCYNNITLE